MTGTATNVNLGGGNTQTHSGSFTKTDSTAGNAGTAHLAGSLLLANNNFYRQFTDDLAITSAAQALPQMQGSGLVRDLRAAMSLGNAQALALQAAVAAFSAGTTKESQWAALDGVVQAWSATSSMQTSVDVVTMPAWHRPWSGNIGSPSDYQTDASYTSIQAFAQASPDLYANWLALERTPQADTVRNKLPRRLMFTTLRLVELSKPKRMCLTMIEKNDDNKCCFARPDLGISEVRFSSPPSTAPI